MMSMAAPGSITRWLDGLKAGQPEAADAIWRRYYQRVVRLARRRLRAAPHQAIEDDEDVALSALNGLYAGAAQGRLVGLSDRDGLWDLLARITVKKARLRRQWYGRRKRGGDRLVPAGTCDGGGADARLDPPDVLARLASREPSPESMAILHELLDRLPDPALRQIAEWRMDGLSTGEIAQKMGCVVRTVQRRIEWIRMIWEEIGLAPEE
jgi:DNA-directed RNA polymerase specialized sigma24 family protein